jgi:hypothetical protein
MISPAAELGKDKSDNYVDPVLAEHLSRMIAPGEVSPAEQLDTMDVFWQSLDQVMPAPTARQEEEMHALLEANSGRRLVIFPFNEHFARGEERLKDTAERAKTQVPGRFTAHDALTTPFYGPEFDGWKYQVAPHASGPGAGIHFRYKTPEGRMATRPDYLTAMAESGRVLVNAEGDTWMYAVMDISADASRAASTASVADLHELVAADNVPEALITMRLMHQMAGVEAPPLTADVANEVAYVGRSQSDHVSVTTVAFDSRVGIKRVLKDYPYSDQTSPHGGYGIRAETPYTPSAELAA